MIVMEIIEGEHNQEEGYLVWNVMEADVSWGVWHSSQ